MTHTLRMAAAAFALTISVASQAFAFGAIAVDDAEGRAASQIGFGVVVGFANKEEAQIAAKRKCYEAGNRNCKVALWFETCGAYAAARATKGIGYGPTLGAAKNMALNQCGDGCQITAAKCE